MAREKMMTKIALRKEGVVSQIAVELDSVLDAGVVKYKGEYYRFAGVGGQFHTIAQFDHTKLCEIPES